MKKTTKKIKNIKISVESHQLLKDYCNKKGYKIYGFLEELIKNNCKVKTDVYGDPLD